MVDALLMRIINIRNKKDDEGSVQKRLGAPGAEIPSKHGECPGR